MHFTLQSARNLLFVIALLLLLSTLGYSGVVSCEDDEGNNVYFCERTYYAETETLETCNDVCSLNKNEDYCKSDDGFFNSFDAKCYADFDFVHEYANLDWVQFNSYLENADNSDLIKFLDKSNFLGGLLIGGSNTALLNELSGKNLKKLGEINFRELPSYSESLRSGDTILSFVLNNFVSVGSTLFDASFSCPDDSSCDINGDGTSFEMVFNGMTLPLNQLKNGDNSNSYSINYDSKEDMLSILMKGASGILNGIKCGDKEINVGFWAQGASFLCTDDHAIANPGSEITYNGYALRNTCGQGCINDVYWGEPKEGEKGIFIVESGGETRFIVKGDVNGFLIKNGGCTVNLRENTDTNELCFEPARGGACSTPFKIECDNGIIANANANCLVTENLPSINAQITGNYCYDFGLGNQTGADECPCNIPGNPIVLSQCGEMVGLDPNDDITFSELQNEYPNCRICSSGTEQKICERALNDLKGTSGLSDDEIFNDDLMGDSIRDSIENARNKCMTTGVIGCEAGTLLSGGDVGGYSPLGCEKVSIMEEFCDVRTGYSTTGKVAITCHNDRGGNAFVVYGDIYEQCNSHIVDRDYIPSGIIGSGVCDAAGKIIEIPVEINKVLSFGVYGGPKCTESTRGSGTTVFGSEKGKCGWPKSNPACTGSTGISVESSGNWKKLCALPDSQGLGIGGDAIIFNDQFFIGVKRYPDSPQARIHKLKPDGSCFENAGFVQGEWELIPTFVPFKDKLYFAAEAFSPSSNSGTIFRINSGGSFEKVHAPGDEVNFACTSTATTIYCGTGDGEIWKSSTGNSGSWQKTFDNEEYTFYYARNFNNAIYFVGFIGEDGSETATVFKSDGNTITKSIRLGQGYAWSSNVLGDYMYVAVREPGSIYRVDKSDAAKQVFSNGENIHRITILDNVLYAGGDTNVFRSEDGIKWTTDIVFNGHPKTVGSFKGKVYAVIQTDAKIPEAWIREGDKEEPEDGKPKCADNDKDGYYAYDETKCPELTKEKQDCDDSNKEIHPGASEVCGNDIDEDCNNVKEQCISGCKDDDKDGYCIDGSGNKDCNDKDASIHPNAVEACNDNIDRDCDNKLDDCPVCVQGQVVGCIGKTGNNEDKTCSYHETCDASGFFGECAKQDSGCQEHGACLEGQTLSCPRQYGVCAGSKQECGSDLKWPGCDYGLIEGYSITETCDDGLDNDCDGSIDEGCFCSNGDTRDCGSIIGECKKGTQTCVNSKWDVCRNNARPRPEKADSFKDNDCDGSEDEWQSCSAKYNEDFERSCGLNYCGEGTQKCSKDADGNLKFTECIGNVVAGLEICQDDADNDCDGSVNEGCGCSTGDTRDCGKDDIGICKKGIQECSGNMLQECEKNVDPEKEKCGDELDNDCDGSIDEGCPCISSDGKNLTSIKCDLQLGVCANKNATCIDGEFKKCDYGINYEMDKEKKCDDVYDNDCDEKRDEQDEDCKQVSGSLSCSDGTQYASCSKTKPYYCSGGILEERCSQCGCPSGETCPSGGKGSCRPDTCGNGRCEQNEASNCPADCPKSISGADSDNDGLTDDVENTEGTNVNDGDTDNDGIGDYDDKTPLCNEDGICDSDKKYAETLDNCSDCEVEDEKNCLVWLGLALLASSIGLMYFVYKDNKSLITEKREIARLEKLNDMGVKERKKAFNASNKKFRNKLVVDIIILILGILVVFFSFAGHGQLISCSIDIVLAVVVITCFIAYLYFALRGKKKKFAKNEIIKPIVQAKKEMEEHKNVEQLNQYVKVALERGVKESEVRSVCINVGWSANEVSNAVSKARTRIDADKFENLRNYIKKSLEKGEKEASIKQKLTKAGWKKEVVDKEFGLLKR